HSNPNLISAAHNLGIRYFHGNMSFPHQVPSCFACAIQHPMASDMYVVPDWPNNTAYQATTPDEETVWYNSFYGPNGKFPYWDHNLSYQEITNSETDISLSYMMQGSPYTQTFHQGNLHQYAPGKS